MPIRNQDQKAQSDQSRGVADEAANAGKAYKVFDPADQPQQYTGKKSQEGKGTPAPGVSSAQTGQMYTDHLAPTYGTEAKRVQPKL